jgi:hypothetical protein
MDGPRFRALVGWTFTILKKMNFRRGFLRLWIVATGIWIAGWAWHYAAICRDSGVLISGFYYCSPSAESFALDPPKDLGQVERALFDRSSHRDTHHWTD